MTHVAGVAAAVTLDDRAQQLIADNAQLERWLRYYLIVPVDQVSIDWIRRTLIVTRGDRSRHPHERAKPTRG